MKQVKTLQIVVASPGDVQPERDELEVIVGELNRTVARDRGLRLELLRWETEAYPGFHPEGPQGLIDELLKIEDCDLLIGIFWKRFGTPTKRAGSGTEHEFLTAYNSWKAKGSPQIMFYFNQLPFTATTSQEAEQLRLVLEFKERFPGEGLWWGYSGKDDFKEKVRQHLTRWLLASFPPSSPSDDSRQSGSQTDLPESTNRTLPELREAYRNGLRRVAGKVRLFGNDRARDLDKVFVTLSITEQYSGLMSDRKLMGLMDASLRRKISLLSYYSYEPSDIFSITGGEAIGRAITPDELLSSTRQAVVTGAPGCGKTTLLKYLALQSILKNAGRWVLYLELKTIQSEDLKASKNLHELLFVKSIVEPLNLSGVEKEKLRADFFNKLNAGQASLFLDGLDEVRHQSIFGDLCRAVSEFAQDENFKKNTLILSTRPFGLHRAPLGDLQQMEIQPLSEKQIEAFLQNYYPSDPAAQRLLRDLKKPGALRDLSRVPVMLAGIIELYISNDSPSETDNRLDIYEKITRRLALKLDQEKNVQHYFFRLADPEGTLKLDFLQQLAFERLLLDENETGTEASRFVFNSEDILAKAKAFVRNEGLREIPPHALADDVKATPLLREVSDGKYAFAHTTLHEYLAAKTLARHENRERIICRSYFNPVLVAQEVLPMALGLMVRADGVYDALEELPESLTLTNFRLRVRGLSYGANIGQAKYAELLERLKSVLVDSSNDEDPYRRTILRDLLFLEGPARLHLEEKIIPYLADTSSFRNLKAAEALAIIGSEKAFDPLVEALNPRAPKGAIISRSVGWNSLDESLVNYVCRALIKIDPEKAVPVLASIHTFYSYGEIDRLLKQVGTEEAFEALLSRRKGSMDWLSSDAAQELSRQSQNNNVIEVLTRALNDRRDNVRGMAVETLGIIGSEDSVQPVADCLRDSHSSVRWKAAHALEKIGSEKAIEPLLQALHDQDSAVRWGAAMALRSMPSETAVDGLISALGDPNADVKYHAASALGQIKSERAVGPLVELMKGGGDPKSRSSAAYALWSIRSKKALAPLLECLADASPQVRAGVAYALGGLRAEEAVEPLHELLSDGSSDVRSGAAYALGQIGSEKSVPYLLKALRSEQDHRASRSMVEALGGIDSVTVVEPLLELYESIFYAHEAAEALAKVSASIMASGLPPLLRHENKLVRGRSTQIIGYYCNEPGIVDELISISQNDPDESVGNAATASLEKYKRKLELFGTSVIELSWDKNRKANVANEER
jgi:HEAT repeat protein